MRSFVLSSTSCVRIAATVPAALALAATLAIGGCDRPQTDAALPAAAVQPTRAEAPVRPPRTAPSASSEALYRAVVEGRIDRMKGLLAAGADPDGLGSDGLSPLHSAARQGNVEMIKLLLEHGADVNVFANSPHEGYANVQPLHWACRSGNYEAVVALVEAGAELNTRSGPYNVTPLGLAAYGDYHTVVRYLVERGAVE
jgi:ankyrin repeat protein